MANEQAPRDDNHVPTILGKDNVTGETKPALIDNVTGRLLVNSTGTGGGQQYSQGDTDATPTGTLAMGFGPGNTIYALDVDSDGHLQVDVLSGGGGGTLVQDGDVVNAANTATLIVGSDGSNYRLLTVDAAGNLQVDLASSLPAGTNSIGVLGANDGVDIGDVTVNNGAGGAAVNIQDGGNSITVDGEVNVDGIAGTDADGSPVTVNPVFIGGVDNTGDARGILTDNNGILALLQSYTGADGASNESGRLQDNTGASRHLAVMPWVYNGSNWDRLRGDSDGVNISDISAGTQTNPVDVEGNIDIDSLPQSSSSAVTTVAGSASSVQLLAANASRLGATIANDSTAELYVKLGTTASTTSFTIKLFQDDYYEVPAGYTGRIDGIWASATGNARITELT